MPLSDRRDPQFDALRLPAISDNAVRGHFLKYGPRAKINAAESHVHHHPLILDKVCESLAVDMIGYNSPQGLPDVIKATQAGLGKLYSLNDLSSDCIMVNGGASEAIPSILRAHMKPGESVLVVDPCFMPTKNFCQEAALFARR